MNQHHVDDIPEEIDFSKGERGKNHDIGSQTKETHHERHLDRTCEGQ